MNHDIGVAMVPIHVWVNGERNELVPTTLANLLEDLGYGQMKVATALNGVFVAATVRGRTIIADGDRLEIVSPRQGG
jgi:sulfur carrier protein